jgi:hypothetical protein
MSNSVVTDSFFGRLLASVVHAPPAVGHSNATTQYLFTCLSSRRWQRFYSSDLPLMFFIVASPVFPRL